jgi:thiol-disulfide isomerase/thioredoxin
MLLLLIIGQGTSLQAQEKFVINGYLPGVKEPKKILLSYSNENGPTEDSTVIRDGRFTFSGMVTVPTHAFLEVLPLGSSDDWTYERMLYRDYQDIFLEKGNMEVKGYDRLDSATITGGQSQKDFLQLQADEQYINTPRAPLLKKWQQALIDKDSPTLKTISPQLHVFEQQYKEAEDRFIHEHPASWVSLDLVEFRSALIDPPTFEPLLKSLDTSLINSPRGRRLMDRLEMVKHTAIGFQAPDFSMKDRYGAPFRLSKTRGKYVLLDFWASWCIPCRADNPNVVTAYRKFHDHDLIIVSVSLDEKKDAWLTAVRKDSLFWTQLSDLNGWKNEAATKYGVHAIPQNFLLDPNGVIIAKNLHGEELLSKLREVLGR